MWPLILAILSLTHGGSADASSSASALLYGDCVSQIKSLCVPTIASCAANLCYLCTSLGISPSIEPCCVAPTPTACFKHNYVSGVTSFPAHPITVPPRPVPSDLASLRPATATLALKRSCNSLDSILTRCEESTPAFGNLLFGSQQTCVCSQSGTYAPSLYDGYYSGCLQLMSIIDPSLYSANAPGAPGQYTGVHDGFTLLGSRPCEKYYAITKTRTTTSDASSTPGPTSSGLGPASSHGPAGGIRVDVRDKVSGAYRRKKIVN